MTTFYEERYLYEQTDKARFDLLYGRHKNFLAVANDVTTEPVLVYDSLKLKQLEELELIREVSKELQKKKIEDIDKQKAAQQKEMEEATEKELVDETEDKKLEEQETPNEGDKDEIKL